MKAKSMKIVVTSLVLAGAVLLPLAANAQEVKGPKVAWNISVWGNSRAWTHGMELIAAEVAKRTGGAFTIKIGYAEQLSPARENLDNLKIGAIEGTFFCSSYHPGKNPGMTALDLPFLPFDNIDVARAVSERFYQHPYIVAEMKKWNALVFMSSPLPQYEFMGVGDPPVKIEDWKGKRVRAPGGLGEAMRKLGATPTSMPAPEVYTSLDRRMVAAASFPFTYKFAADRLHEISKWYTDNLAPGAINCPTAFALTALEKLPPQYRKLLDSLKEPAYLAIKQGYKTADDKNIPLFKKTLTPIHYSDEEIARFRAIGGKPVWDKWVSENAAKGVPAQELLNLILDTAKKASGK